MAIWIKNNRHHILIWVALLLYAAFNNSYIGSLVSTICFIILFNLNHGIAYYLFTLKVFPYFETKDYFGLVYWFLCVLVFYITFDLIHFKVIIPFLHGKTRRDNIELLLFFSRSFYWIAQILFVAIAFYYLKWSKKLKEDSIRMEALLLSRESTILKSQFHSHFNFNFLNFCYAKILRHSPLAAQTVIHYSETLRYGLILDVKKPIAIAEEILHVKHIIDLHKGLYTNVNCELELFLDQDQYFVQPLLLGVIVEYAFSVNHQKEEENRILRLRLQIQKSVLAFNIRGLKGSQLKEIDQKLSKLKEWLDIYYLNRYSLDGNQAKQNNHLSLTIHLNEIYI